MFGRSFALVSAVALTAQAFLIPTTEFTKETTSIQEQDSHALKITCPGCPFAESDGPGKGFHWISSKENALVLDFTVNDASQALEINGITMYPLNTSPQPLSAIQVPQELDISTLTDDVTYARLPLSYEMSVTQKAQESGNELLSLYFSIIGIEGRPVIGLNDVEVSLIKTSENRLHIAKIERKPGSGKCTASPLLCKWKAIIAAKLAAMKASIKGGCQKFRPGHKTGPTKDHKKPAQSGALPSHHHHTKPHGHHGHKHHGLRKLFGKIKHLLIKHPVLVGIAAGLSAGVLGMIVGSVIVLLMRAVGMRRSRGVYMRVQQVEELPEDVKDEDLPQYEDLPATDQKDVIDKN